MASYCSSCCRRRLCRLQRHASRSAGCLRGRGATRSGPMEGETKQGVCVCVRVKAAEFSFLVA